MGGDEREAGQEERPLEGGDARSARAARRLGSRRKRLRARTPSPGRRHRCMLRRGSGAAGGSPRTMGRSPGPRRCGPPAAAVAVAAAIRPPPGLAAFSSRPTSAIVPRKLMNVAAATRPCSRARRVARSAPGAAYGRSTSPRRSRTAPRDLASHGVAPFGRPRRRRAGRRPVACAGCRSRRIGPPEDGVVERRRFAKAGGAPSTRAARPCTPAARTSPLGQAGVRRSSAGPRAARRATTPSPRSPRRAPDLATQRIASMIAGVRLRFPVRCCTSALWRRSTAGAPTSIAMSITAAPRAGAVAGRHQHGSTARDARPPRPRSPHQPQRDEQTAQVRVVVVEVPRPP